LEQESSSVRFGNLLVNSQLPAYCNYIKCFSAIQEGFDRSVELRMLGKEFTEETPEFQHFRTERRAFSVLDQTNIVKVLDGGVLNGTNYYMINGVNSQSIDILINKQNKTFSTKEILIVMNELSNALSHIHDLGYLHLDLSTKTAYMITGTSQTIINSFSTGVNSLSLPAIPDSIPAESIVRKTPEAIEGRTIDCKTDVFLLCGLAYHMGTGVSPFGEAYFDTDARGKQKLRPIAASSISGSISRQLNELIMKGLSKDPDERYHFADELVATTEKALRKLEIKERVSESAELTASSIRIDPELIKQIRAQKKQKQEEIKKQHTENQEDTKSAAPDIMATIREALGANPVIMVVPVLVLFFIGAVSSMMGPSTPSNTPGRSSTSSTSGNKTTGTSNKGTSPSGTSTTNSESTNKPQTKSTKGANNSMKDAINEVRSNSTSKKSFKSRWKFFQQWYKKQPKDTRANQICSYSQLAQLKLRFYKSPDSSAKELDSLYKKAEEYINKN